MSAVLEELHQESEPQYNEKLIPEAQLLEHPFDIINGLQQAASEGIVPQVEDAISLAHLPSEGFKITHEYKPDTQIEPNDGKAAIVAGICGVTKSCEDRCCPIGDLDKARVRVGLINELKLNDPDFFNNPNADKIIKERVNEIMEQKQQLANSEVANLNSQSPAEPADKPTKEKSTQESSNEVKKPKVELPTSFFGRQLSPQEAEQRMKELSGTYTQGKKISTPEVSTTVPEKKPETPTVEIDQQIDTKPSETLVQKPVEQLPSISVSSEQVLKPVIHEHIKNMIKNSPPQESKEEPTSSEPQIESVTPTKQIPEPVNTPYVEATAQVKQEIIIPFVPQERIDRHRPQSEHTTNTVPPVKIEQKASSVIINEPPVLEHVTKHHQPKPEIQQNRPEQPTITESTVIPISIEPIRPQQTEFKSIKNEKSQSRIDNNTFQPPTIDEMSQTFTIPTGISENSIPDNVSLPQPERQNSRVIMQTEQLSTPTITDNLSITDISMPSQQQERPATTFNADMPQSISFTEKTVVQNQEITIQQLDQSFQTPSSEIPSVINQEIIITLRESMTIQEPINTISTEKDDSPTVLVEEIGSEDVLPQNNTEEKVIVHTPEDTTTVFAYTETVTETVVQSSIKQSTDIPAVKIPEINILEPHSDPIVNSDSFKLDEALPGVSINLEQTVNLVDPDEPLQHMSEIIIESAVAETFTQLLTSLISTEEDIVEQIQPVSVEDTQIIEDPLSIHTEALENNHIEVTLSPPTETIIVAVTTSEDLKQTIESLVQESDYRPLIVLTVPQVNEISTQSTEQVEDISNEEPSTESFIVHMLNQEELLDFVSLIDQITTILAFLHSSQNVDITELTDEITNEVTPEELKNDTFGKYDDTVAMTLWPIVQFMLYMQSLQIFIPQQSQLTTVT